MTAPTPGSSFERLLAPRALLLGVAAAFLGCCLAGHLASRRNAIHDFERFHPLLAPESLYFPTVGQVRQLAKSRLDPDKVVVIVGGSSVLHGTCQRADHSWAHHLQEQLGDRYQVLNLAMRAGDTAEFGAVMAEVLGRDFPKLILVADMKPGWVHPDVGGARHAFLFWDAYYKGLLLPHADRDRRLADQVTEVERIEQEQGKAAVPVHRHGAERQRELRAEMWLDRALYFHDLWNGLAYNRVHTVWTLFSRESVTRARRRYPDIDTGPLPPHLRYLPEDHDRAMQMLRATLVAQDTQGAGKGLADGDSAGAWEALDRRVAAAFPPQARGRTLLLVRWFSPHYLGHLTPDERGLFCWVCRETVRRMGSLGFAAQEVGPEFSRDDFADMVHLTEEGGAKLAAAVAPRVREQAQRLGFVSEGGAE
jgi:hypothetical protein